MTEDFQEWGAEALDRHVHVQPLFATWSADWDLLGSPVWFFVGLGLVAAGLLSRFSPLPAAAQHRVLLALPGLMLFGCLFTRWVQSRSASFLDWYFYKFYYAELDTAFIVSFAFGAGFTLDSLRARERICRIVGWSFIPLYVGLLAMALWYIQGAYHWFELRE